MQLLCCAEDMCNDGRSAAQAAFARPAPGVLPARGTVRKAPRPVLQGAERRESRRSWRAELTHAAKQRRPYAPADGPTRAQLQNT